MQRLPVDEFESNINQQGVNRADFLESGLNFLAPVSLEDPVESKVAKAVRSMVPFLSLGILHVPEGLLHVSIQVSQVEDPAKMFMVTGDQLATALSAAHNSGMTESSDLIDLDKVECHHPGTEQGEMCMWCLEEFEQRLHNDWTGLQPGSVLAVGPWVMEIVTKERELAERTKRELMELCKRAEAVIFYRMQPEFKAEIAKLAKRYLGVVLSIGDGGNDALMLEESDVGVAIAAHDAANSGAQLSCDISIPSFAVLPRLVHVHGSVIALRFQGLILLDLQARFLMTFLWKQCVCDVSINHAVK